MSEKPNVFLSWSGQSKGVAAALKEWLPLVIHNARPWFSNDDIRGGGPWLPQILEALRECEVGICCFVQGNYERPWVMLEAGAIIGKTKDQGTAFTYLHNVEYAEFTGPLKDFQHRPSTKAGTLDLVNDVNSALGSKVNSETLKKLFEKLWPDFDRDLKAIEVEEQPEPPRRSERDMLDELIELNRAMSADQSRLIELVSSPRSNPKVGFLPTGVHWAGKAARDRRSRTLHMRVFDVRGKLVGGGSVLLSADYSPLEAVEDFLLKTEQVDRGQVLCKVEGEPRQIFYFTWDKGGLIVNTTVLEELADPVLPEGDEV